MPFKSEKQRRYLHANHPGIAKRWEQEYSGGGIARMGYANGTGFSGLTQEMLDMTYPDQYYKNVIEPAKTGKGPLPSKLNMIKNAGITGPFKAMRIGMDPYLPKSMQAGYDAFRAAPTTGAARFLGSNIATGLPLGYAALADSLQGRLEDQGLTGEGGIYDVAGFDDPMSAGASVEYDMGTRPSYDDSAFLGFERGSTDYPSLGFERGSTDYPSDIDEEALGMSRRFEDIDEESSYYDTVEGLPSIENKFNFPGLNWDNISSGIGTAFSLANDTMPWGLARRGFNALTSGFNRGPRKPDNYGRGLSGNVSFMGSRYDKEHGAGAYKNQQIKNWNKKYGTMKYKTKKMQDKQKKMNDIMVKQELEAKKTEIAKRQATANAQASRGQTTSGGKGNYRGSRDHSGRGGYGGRGRESDAARSNDLGFSDIRLKDNIEFIGQSPSNINIYKFNYLKDPTVYQGVMAQDVPWASVKSDNGYLMVDYNKVDVEFKKWHKK